MAFYSYGDFCIFSFSPLLNWIRIGSGEMPLDDCSHRLAMDALERKARFFFRLALQVAIYSYPFQQRSFRTESQKISYKDPTKGPHIRRLKSSFIHSESLLHPLLLPPLFLKLRHHGVSVGSQ